MSNLIMGSARLDLIGSASSKSYYRIKFAGDSDPVNGNQSN